MAGRRRKDDHSGSQTERVSAQRRQAISHPRGGGWAGELQIQQPGIQMTMTGIDAPSWFFHKAIPPHQLLGGRVELCQHNTDKTVSYRHLT